MSEYGRNFNERALRDHDRWLTSSPYDEKENAMLPAGTEVTCPSCDTEFTTKKDIHDDDTVHCDNCDTKLVLIDGDFEEYEEAEDIVEEDDELGEEEDDVHS